VSVARFIADQRTFYRVPHAFTCRVLAVSEAWFYKWVKAPTTDRGQRRALLDEAVREAFRKSGASYGSPRCGRTWSTLSCRTRSSPSWPRNPRLRSSGCALSPPIRSPPSTSPTPIRARRLPPAEPRVRTRILCWTGFLVPTGLLGAWHGGCR